MTIIRLAHYRWLRAQEAVNRIFRETLPEERMKSVEDLLAEEAARQLKRGREFAASQATVVPLRAVELKFDSSNPTGRKNPWNRKN
ncbi:MAG: hypothetical protein AAB804_00395 [Patescibacteria group bacterium]